MRPVPPSSGSPPHSGVGRVGRLRRYPVKSLLGEELDRVHVERRGLSGDRLWSVRDPDGKLGSGKSSRRFRAMDGLLELSARYDGDTPVLELADGRTVRGDDPDVDVALSAHVGRGVTLGREAEVSHFDDGPVHLVTTSSLRALERAHGSPVDVRRLRPNVVVETAGDGFVEDDWVGRRVALGADVVLEITATMPRCVMVTLAQRDLPADRGLLQSVTGANDMSVGVVADVVRSGALAVGDEVRLTD